MSNLPPSSIEQEFNPTPDGQHDLPSDSPESTRRVKLPISSKRLYLVLFYLVILGIAVGIKWSFRTFDALKYYYDTASYAVVADAPLNSMAFWAGPRPFTLPLFYKALGVDSLNYKDPAVMDRVSLIQAGLSILCWAVLGFTISRRARNRWLGGAIFGLVLAFSLVYEISRWDLGLLTESLSFSLFALLLAGWIVLLGLRSSTQKSAQAYLILFGVIIITLLYAFTRTANPYFVVMCAALLAAASLIRRFGLSRVLTLIYLIAAILIYFAQDASSTLADRWQIFIYDHMALRLTDTPEFVDYFTRAGLPMIERLYKPLDMRGSVYDNMLLYDPEFEPVRQWMKDHGKATFIGYLISYPKMTLGQPLIYASQLLNGTAESVLYHSYEGPYRTPLHKGQWVPRWERGLTKLLFPTSPVWVYTIVYLGLLGLTGWGLWQRWDLATWLPIAILLVTLYPMMVLVWIGDPLEVERHALQIAISFRLAGMLALAMAIDHWIYVLGKKATSTVRGLSSTTI